MVIPMTKRKRRYWAMRTDKYNRNLLWRELEAEHLRQGWGYDPSQDLRIVASAVEAKQPLTDIQEQTKRHRRMLTSQPDGIKPGDWVLVPNLPEQGMFVIVEVTGGYYFEPKLLSKEEDIHGLGQDYGHVLPVRLLTPKGVNKYAEGVHASIRSTLRSQHRLWSLDKYDKHIESIVADCKAGKDLSRPATGEDRAKIAAELATQKARETLRDKLFAELDSRFQAAEWEQVIFKALQNLYPGSVVRHTGGRNEKGADIVVEIPNRFDDAEGPWQILIQVKNYDDTIGPKVLHQLKQAFNAYSEGGPVLLLAALTTAEKANEEALQKAKDLSLELGTPVRIVTRELLAELLAEGLVPQPAQI